MPEETKTPEGRERRVGVEMEMAGLPLADLAAAVLKVFGGRIAEKGAFVIRIEETRHGSFQVELDADILKSHEYRPYLDKLGITMEDAADKARLDDLLARLAGSVVPHEIVAPPIPLSELEQMDELRLELYRAGAKGTRAALVYAFGAQFNVEAARLDAEALRDILKAYVLLHDRLVERGTVDIARKLSPFVRPFPGSYARLILAEGYGPELKTLIGDYLRHNPTRNRPLDMLPLFAHLDYDQVMSAPVETHLVKARPAFHYRLPNCQIDEPGWSLSLPWSDWLMIEKLADDKERLAEYAKAYLDRPGEILAGMVEEWIESLGAWFGK
jgi:hypothetical protein